MKKLLFIMVAMCAILFPALAEAKVVSGTVVDSETGEPLVGASVLPIGSTNGTSTDFDGKFTFNVPDYVKQLKISYVGYEEQTVAAGQNIVVKLASDETVLQDLVVTGYGSGKKAGSVVGAVTVVGEKQFEKITTANFTDALQGQVSGLSVLSNSGDPSKSASIRLRGINSIQAGVAPLYILDGAPISSTLFNTLNPSDIESISVLKDAASTSIYGSRAANGVIVITSKKGRYGETAKVNIRAQYGFSQIVDDKQEMMNSAQYVKFRDMIGVPVTDEVRELVERYGMSTNWRKVLFDSSAPTYTLDASIQGGTANTSYYLSVNHHDQQGIIEQSGMRRESVRFNFDSKIKNWLKVGLSANLGYTKYEQNSESEASGSPYLTNPAFLSRFALPYDSPYYYTIENDKVVWGEKAEYLKYTGVPTPAFVNKMRDVYKRRVTANINLYEQIQPIKGLTIRTQQAVDAYDYNYEGASFPYNSFVTPMGSSVNGRNGAASKSFTRYYSFTYTNTAEYKFNVATDHHFTLLLGEESIMSKSSGFGVSTSGQTDIRQMLLHQGTIISIADGDVSESRSESVFNSYFLNMNYDWNEKYYLDATVRRDGSSKFAPNTRWSTFWSVGAMWNIYKEKFMADIDWINALSLKVSYGTTGNSSIGDYAFYGLLGSGSSYNQKGTIGISQPSNYNLTWETVNSFDVGISTRLFDRLNLNVDFYDKRTENMLLDIPYSYTTGYSKGTGNIGSMANTGVDIDVKVDILKGRDYYWNFRANFNYNNDRITKLFNGRDEFTLENYGLQLKVGHSSGEFWSVRYAGVDPRDGKQMWYTKDNNLTKVFNEERDGVLLGKSMYAPLNGGFGTEAGWKGISVGADFTWAGDKYLLSNDNIYLENPTKFGALYNQTTRMLNIWTTPGQITDVPKYGESIEFDDHVIENASFLRLKKVTVQYTLPSFLTKKAGIERANFFFVGRNLWTLTDYSGYDPEPDSNLVRFNYPNTKQYVFGVEVTF